MSCLWRAPSPVKALASNVPQSSSGCASMTKVLAKIKPSAGGCGASGMKISGVPSVRTICSVLTIIAARRRAEADISEFAASRELKRLSGLDLLEAHGEKRGRSQARSHVEKGPDEPYEVVAAAR